MKKKLLMALLAGMCFDLASAQYAPQVGNAGTTAIHKDSSVFVNWATGCSLSRGWQNIADTLLGKALVGDETYVPGAAGNGIVSLGDGGEAIVTFAKPVRNGDGFDFAVFENGFIDQTLKPGTAFLELAFVEVSSDGIHFFRFPSFSNNDTVSQLASFDGIDARTIHNLAGKYLANYGTPFDLEDLKGTAGLDLERITHVKIIDVVGALTPAHASRDSRGVIVNDPWPTPFSQSGFDLDGVGVINQNNNTGLKEQLLNASVDVFPNPANTGRIITLSTSENALKHIEVYNSTGQLVILTNTNTFEINKAGLYLIHCFMQDGMVVQKLIIQ